MNPLKVRWTLILASSALMASAHAGDKKEVVPMQEPEARSKWSVSAGAEVSSIKTTFRADPTAVGLLPPSPGGSPFLYTGGPTPQVYQDGSVGTSGPSVAGTTQFTGGTPGTNPTNGFLTETFHGSSGYALSRHDASDTELSAGPYIKLAYEIKNFGGSSISIFGQYAFTTAFNSAQPNQTAVRTDHTFTYDALPPPIVAAGPALIIYNATLFNTANASNAQAPRDVAVPTAFSAITNSSVNIYEHTVTLGLDFTKDLGDRVHLVLSTGPTLNLFDTSFRSFTTGVAGGVPVVGSAPVSHSSQKFRFGWIGKLGLVFDLDSRKRYFLEAAADYHWVDQFDVSAGTASARINASSWGANLGLGVRF